MDAGFFQLLGRTDAFPGRGELDQHAVTANASFVVQLDQLVGFLQQGRFVKRQAGIDFSRNSPWNDLQDTATHRHREQVAGQANIALAVLDGVFQQIGIAGQRGSFEQQRRIGGGINGFEAGNRIEVAGVCDHGGELLELFQLGSHGRLCLE